MRFLQNLKLRWKLLVMVLPLVVVPILVVGGVVGAVATRQAYLGITQTSEDDLEHMAQFTLDLLNAHRSSVGCPSLAWSGSVADVAQGHSDDMVCFVVSDGSGVNPYRIKVKSPCFTALSAFHQLARGLYIADIVALIGSLDIVLGEIDR